MQFSQVKDIVNSVTKEIIGSTEIVTDDLSNIVDIGRTVMGSTGMDNYVKTLVDHIGKVVFVNRAYSGTAPSVLMDGWEYGAILEKISYDGLPEATENESWELTNGVSYDPNVFTKPQVSAKFFDKRVTFETPMSFAEKQVKTAFDSVGQLNAFFSMIHNAIDKSQTVKIDGLVERTLNNMIGETLADTSLSKGVRAVNLFELYKAKFPTDNTLTIGNCINHPAFIRFASLIISLYTERMTKISTLFNVGGKDRFTSKDLQHIVLLAEFQKASGAYLESDTFHNEFIKLPNAETVPYWQGSGLDYSFESTSKININTSSGSTITQTGILGVIFDRDSLGVSNLNRRVTADYNAKGEFFNNWYKFDAGYFNDLNENFVVFYVEDVA